MLGCSDQRNRPRSKGPRGRRDSGLRSAPRSLYRGGSREAALGSTPAASLSQRVPSAFRAAMTTPHYGARADARSAAHGPPSPAGWSPLRQGGCEVDRVPVCSLPRLWWPHSPAGCVHGRQEGRRQRQCRTEITAAWVREQAQTPRGTATGDRESGRLAAGHGPTLSGDGRAGISGKP